LLPRLVQQLRIENEPYPRKPSRKGDAHAANLRSLLSAYGAVHIRRELRMRGGSSFYASSVVSSSSAPSNSIFPSKI
jgi:hypothetical protein